MSILLFLFIPLWMIAAGKDLLFWTYLWQLKEYRKDRMRAHMALPTARGLLFNNKVKVIAGLFLVSLIAIFVPPLAIAAGIATVLFYILVAYRAYIHMHERQLRVPRFTAKVILILGIAAAIYIAILTTALARPVPGGFAILLAADLLVPACVTLLVALLRPLSSAAKKRAIAKAARKRHNLKDLLVVGITGSYGKTSTKDFLAHILEKKFRVHKTPENTNTEFGVARDFLSHVTNKHDIYIAEVGAYKRGEIAAISEVLSPNIGVLTGISNQHIALFGSQENIQRAKHELIDSLGEDGLAIFNGDSDQCAELFSVYKKAKRLYTSELPEKGVYNGIFAKDIRYRGDGIRMEVTDRKETVRMEAPLLGYANAVNILGAATVAHALGVDLSYIASRTKTLVASPRTMEPRRGIKGSRVIDDSYSGNQEGALAALDTLKMVEGNKKICIFHPLVELGDDAIRVHRAIGKRIGETCDACIVVSRDFFDDMYKEATSAGMEKGAIIAIGDSYLAMRKAQEMIEENDVVLLENRVPEQVRTGIIL